ncbi:g8931 [Coccomyxa elongata]
MPYVAHTPQRLLSNRFLTSVGGLEQRLVLLILNFRLPPVTSALWKHAHLKVVADGGANQLYDSITSWPIHKLPKLTPADFVPDIIKGDLDSIRPEVLDFYKQLGSRIVDLSNDQDTTDLQKCIECTLHQITENHARLDGASIFAVGALGGRMDHVLSSLNTLYKHEGHKIVLCGDGNMVRLLPAGRSLLVPDRSIEGPACGLVTMGAPATASSTGLKWNLDKTRLEVGGLQSTSNIIVDDHIVIDTDYPLLWMTELHDPVA